MSHVDSAQQLNCVEWCFGYGGMYLGLKRVLPTMRLIAGCEIEAYAVANMVAKMEQGFLDAAPIWSDCKTFPGEDFRGIVDIFIASYPCQPFSSAGKRRGFRDERNLWPAVRRGYQTMRPRWVFFENVEGHINNGLRKVLADLEADGYRRAWGIFSAAEVGASHVRKRVFILGQLADTNQGGWVGGPIAQSSWPIESNFAGESNSVADAIGERQQQPIRDQREGGRRTTNGGENVAVTGSGKLSESGWEKSDGSWAGSDGKDVDNATSPRCNDEGQRSKAMQQGGECVSGERCSDLADRDSSRCEQQCRPITTSSPQTTFECCLPEFPPRPNDLDAWGKVLTHDPTLEPALCGVAHGRVFRVDELRLAGNGVVPAVAAKAFVTLYRELNP